MKKELIARAWKDPEFRARLSEEQRASLPECPSGTPMSELDESELHEAAGGRLLTAHHNCNWSPLCVQN